MSRVLFYEVRKLTENKIIWIFLVVCLCLNGLIIISEALGYSYPDYVAGYAKKNGVVINTEHEPPQDDNRYYAEMLQTEIDGAYDPYSGYSTDYVGEAYIRAINYKGVFADMIRAKYDRLQTSVDELAGTDAPMTLYYAGDTARMHSFIFGTVMRFLSMEGSVAAALIAMLSIATEKNSSTETLVYSSRKGRKLYIYKLAASMAVSFIAFASVAMVTMLLLFIFIPIGPIMGSSVCSVFNYINDYLAGLRPFVTWQDMTVWQYMLASLGVSVLMVLCACLCGYAAQIICRTTYIAFGVLMILTILPMFLASISPSGTIIWILSCLSPVYLWQNLEVWFTDGGGAFVFVNYELVGMAFALLTAAVCAAVSIILAKRSDILCED